MTSLNIYGHSKKALIEIGTVLNKSQKPNNDSILNALKSSWIFIEKYIKNINPEWTTFYSERLARIDPNELIITSNMIDDAKRIYTSLEKTRDIKLFMNEYMSITERLLTFSRTDKESCDICEGDLFYYYEIESSTLIKECGTCACWFDGITNERVEVFSKNIRAATKTDLLKEKIIEIN